MVGNNNYFFTIKSVWGKLYKKFRVLILYGVIGCFASTLDFITFTILARYIGVYYLIANCISVLVGIITSFLLNRAYNFKVKDKIIRRFLIFFSVGLCGMLFSNFILWIGIDKLGADTIIVKILSIVIVVVVQFLLNKYVTFRVVK